MMNSPPNTEMGRLFASFIKNALYESKFKDLDLQTRLMNKTNAMFQNSLTQINAAVSQLRKELIVQKQINNKIQEDLDQKNNQYKELDKYNKFMQGQLLNSQNLEAKLNSLIEQSQNEKQLQEQKVLRAEKIKNMLLQRQQLKQKNQQYKQTNLQLKEDTKIDNEVYNYIRKLENELMNSNTDIDNVKLQNDMLKKQVDTQQQYIQEIQQQVTDFDDVQKILFLISGQKSVEKALIEYQHLRDKWVEKQLSKQKTTNPINDDHPQSMYTNTQQLNDGMLENIIKKLKQTED